MRHHLEFAQLTIQFDHCILPSYVRLLWKFKSCIRIDRIEEFASQGTCTLVRWELPNKTGYAHFKHVNALCNRETESKHGFSINKIPSVCCNMLKLKVVGPHLVLQSWPKEEHHMQPKSNFRVSYNLFPCKNSWPLLGYPSQPCDVAGPLGPSWVRSFKVPHD